MRHLIFLSVLVIGGCVEDGKSPIPSFLPEIKYRYDMKVQADDDTFDGVGALDKKKMVIFKLSWKHTAEIIKITTCHREHVIETDSLFGGEKKYQWKYYPTSVEKSGYCPVWFGAYDVNGQHSWGFIEMASEPNETLKASVRCNGRFDARRGVSVCQSRAGLFQNISFTESTQAIGEEGCSEPEKVGWSYDIQASPKLCRYIFIGEKSKEVHRLTMLGYSKVLLRSIKADNQ